MRQKYTRDKYGSIYNIYILHIQHLCQNMNNLLHTEARKCQKKGCLSKHVPESNLQLRDSELLFLTQHFLISASV